MVEFAGYMMPVQYKGIREEHNAVRNSVGIFDVSHMGEFFVHGEGAATFLQKMTINDITKLELHRAQYSAICNEQGGLLDDLIIYCFGDYYMMIVNASNRDKDYAWLSKHLPADVMLDDRSDEFSLFAVQGRNAEKTLQKIADVDLSAIKFYGFREGVIAGCKAFIARTGYTGEDGFELGVDSAQAANVWNAVLEAGQEFNIEPIGLAARDTLRTEMKYCLYGNDIDETTNPIEAGLGWITKVDKGDFIGRDSILKIKEKSPKRKLVGFELTSRGMARHGYKIIKEGVEIGHVASGSFSPSLDKAIGIAYIDVPHNKIGTEIALPIRGKEISGVIVKTPFYQREY